MYPALPKTRSRGWMAHRLVPALAVLVLACGESPPERVGDRPATPEAWAAQRARLDETVWAHEVMAREYEGTLVSLWDALIDADRRGRPADKARILASTDFTSLRLGTPEQVEDLELDIERFRFAAPYRELTPAAWTDVLAGWAREGLVLVQSEWHHARFAAPSQDSPARSDVAVALHVLDPVRGLRIAIEGELAVEWSTRRDARGDPVPDKVDATRLRMWTRAGPPPFERIFEYGGPPGARGGRLHPILLYDLDGDGRTDIVAQGASRVLWNGAEGFRDDGLVEHPYALAETGVVADLTGDGHADLLAPRARGDLLLYRGDARGRFPDEPLATAFEEPLRGPSALSVGDVDADGDLDVWLGQYKPAYAGGQMPTPYFDANDGHPAHLLRNRGDGQLTPVTDAAGLGEKRFRRSYAGSLVDLDGDRDLDLLVVSDYAGVDLHHNDGRGHFSDAGDTLRGDRHLFGMSAALADYDLDGRLDIFVAGMASTTARRLEAAGLSRRDRPEIGAMRMRMAWGNRMYLASDDGWREPEFAPDVARTGWTWGTTAFDLDNDGDRDLFAANGHISGESTQDYCSNFWTHDLHDGTSTPDAALGRVFAEAGAGLREGAESWDGYQKNQLLMNRNGRGFVNVAFLLGVADAFDGRSAVSEDLDLDGRVDLVVVEDHGAQGQRLHVYRNGLETGNAWIGVKLRERAGGPSPVGASVLVRTPERTHVARVVTGETLMGQHANTLHFGLGRQPRVDSIEVHWPDGRSRSLPNPELGRYHVVESPPSRTGTRNP